jgi:hypothetical protein
MKAKPEPGTDRFSLRRWSQRKLAAVRPEPTAIPAADVSAAPAAATPTTPAATPAAAELPPIESLTLESDFAVFFKPEVDDKLKRAALRQLFRDPRFNVMDGLDVYIDDYTKADPIPADVLKQLLQTRYIFDPPPTELTPEGYVVDATPKPATDVTSLPPPADTAPGPPAEAEAPTAPAAAPGNATDANQ